MTFEDILTAIDALSIRVQEKSARLDAIMRETDALHDALRQDTAEIARLTREMGRLELES